MVEYVLVFCALAVLVAALARFAGSAGRSVERTEALIGSDSP